MKLRERIRNRRSFEAFLKNDTGASAIEFAFLAPMFFLFLFIVFETGIMMFTEYVIQTAVQDASRQVRTGQTQQASGMNANEFKKEICQFSGSVVDCSRLVVFLRAAPEANPTFAALAAAVPSYLTIGPDASGNIATQPFECGKPGQPVVLVATYDWEFYVPAFMGFLANVNGGNDTRRLVGFSIFKNEPYPATGAQSC
jgi:Flp pilus assembly protein TadG